MKIQTISQKSYTISLKNGQTRTGILIKVTDQTGKIGWGEIAPLPGWSQETLEEALAQLTQKQPEVCEIEWNPKTLFIELARLRILPSVTFGLESALLTLLSPLGEHKVTTSALLMGTPPEILQQAKLRLSEGFTSAKLKVSHLSFQEAAELIHQLKETFYLRIDVNRAWNTAESLHFFSQFPLDTFDYVEEPFKNPKDLSQFTHPLAVDESYPDDLSLEDLESLPTLKALIYKPTIQGGLTGCFPLHEWTKQKGVSLVLSSSFESDLGLAHIASIAHRLSLTAPVGIGTYHFLNDFVADVPLQFFGPDVYIPESN